MEIHNGKKEITIKGQRRQAIIEFDIDNYTLYVFKGSITDFDILIKYKKDKTRIRTPKHIHWAVDILIKMQYEKQLTKEFLKEVKLIWDNCSRLQKNDFETLKNLVEQSKGAIKMELFKALNSYGEYPVDFLFVLMILLATQEKTNREDAYMFGNIIDELLKTNYDIFKIISTAGFTGRN